MRRRDHSGYGLSYQLMRGGVVMYHILSLAEPISKMIPATYHDNEGFPGIRMQIFYMWWIDGEIQSPILDIAPGFDLEKIRR